MEEPRRLLELRDVFRGSSISARPSRLNQQRASGLSPHSRNKNHWSTVYQALDMAASSSHVS